MEGVTDLAIPNKAVFWKESQIWRVQKKLILNFEKVAQIWRVQKIRDFKLWLLAYFVILFNCAKFQKDRTTFILHILKESPLNVFLFL